MKNVIVLVTLMGSVVAAQQPPVSSATQNSERQPRTISPLAVVRESVRSTGWSLRPDVVSESESAGVTAHGAGVRIQAGGDATLYQPDWHLTGTFSVGATFQTTGASGLYGLTLGGPRGLAFLVRGEGALAVTVLSNGKPTGGSWAPIKLRPFDDEGRATRLEVRVGPSEATFVVDGQVVRTLAISPGQLDGVPGVHVDGSDAVTVSGFTVQTAATQFVDKQ